MEYKIIEMRYGSGTPYYIVKVKKLFWWGMPSKSSILVDLSFAITSAYWDYIRFTSIENAENAIQEEILRVKSINYGKEIKVIDSNTIN